MPVVALTPRRAIIMGDPMRVAEMNVDLSDAEKIQLDSEKVASGYVEASYICAASMRAMNRWCPRFPSW